MKKSEGNPYLRAAIYEALGNQLKNNDPPETRQTYERLLGEGIEAEEVKRLIGCVLCAEISDIMKTQNSFKFRAPGLIPPSFRRYTFSVR
jgi:hypothetical protein